MDNPRPEKVAVVDEVRQRFSDSDAVLLTEYRGINVGESPATDGGQFARLRDELWWRTREWFAGRDVSIPEDARLIGELTSVQYAYTSAGKLQVESKDSMRKRGLKSPDCADALVLTFAGGLDRPMVEKRYERYSKRGSGGGSWMAL